MSIGADSQRSQEDKMILSKTKFITQQRNFLGVYNQLNKQTSAMSKAAPVREPAQVLPQLPVPKLSITIDKYLKSVEPFLNESELNHTKKLLAQFQSENGLGPKLQKLLVERAKKTENWLSDWWLDCAYLQYRDPVVIFSSPGLVFPLQQFKNEDERLDYAAKLIIGALCYKELIDSGKMAIDKMGKESLDMNQYKKIFGTCRIPGLKQDHIEFNPQSKHIVIVRNNNYFKLQVITDCGKILNTGELISSLQEIINQSQEVGPAIGVLTTENRDNWAKIHQHMTLDVTNCKSLREIQTSLFVLCLDKAAPKSEDSNKTIASRQLIHGGGGRANAANRWFDKTVQFVVGEDGIVGLTYEHSPSEGQPIAVMTDYVVDYIKSDTSINQPDVGFVSEPERLYFNVDDQIQKAIYAATIHANKLVDNLDMNCFQYKAYGKNFVKSQKMSPDSFLQIAMQYAFYRIHKVPGAHYESAATRKYIHGRTETIRSCSNESIAFAKAMLDPSKSDQDKVAALLKAVDAHKKYSIEAVNGFGVDRHFFGLKIIAAENNLPIPEIFDDPAFSRSSHMRLSTSQVATKCDGFMCYGTLTADGYGFCYNPRDNDMNFAISARCECPETSALQFRQAFEASLQEMHDILAKTQKSKL